MLRRHCNGKTPAALESALYFTVVAGDQHAESCAGHVRNTMRRVANTGRVTSKQSVNAKNIQVLAAAKLLRSPGLDTRLAAVAEYRQDCSCGVLKVAPGKAFSYDEAGKWLFKD